ncbi:MAG TPA: PIG-L family deacetylase [Anaerolineales bacterium]|nr:PIG-L family deacetylase [Anaerolineales bacterium]
MNLYGQTVLFLGAHPDDIELGCGGLLANISGKTDVLCATLSDNQDNPELKAIVGQHYRSMNVLGVPRDQVILEHFETRNFPRDRQAILEYLYDLGRRHKPDIVFVHTQADIHQDHAVVTMEALRAFRGTTVLGYDVLRSSYGFFPHFLVEITGEDVERKIKALAEYTVYSDKYYFDPETIRATSIRHGALAEREFAEGFDILRVVGAFAGRIP